MFLQMVKWASHNVGATSPEGYGGYYAWGETAEKETYSRDNYQYYNNGYQAIGTYNSSNSEYDISGTNYDVAHTSWGGTWRMPTKTEFNELITSCTSTWVTYKGVNGRLFTGPNGNKIFLPASSFRNDGPASPGSIGTYWSSTNASGGSTSKELYFHDSNVSIEGSDRWHGRTVRPVKGE